MPPYERALRMADRHSIRGQRGSNFEGGVMRTYKLTIAYDGTRYQGWQRQPDTELTIQGMLEGAVCALKGYPVEVNGSGRTDGGVHAEAQTASIRLSGKVEEEPFLEELNRTLPEDIRVTGMELVKNGFHARYSASGKRYEYTVDTREKADVFTRKYCFHFPEKLDMGAMKKAADCLVGKHDLAAFTDRNEDQSTIRTIYAIRISKEGSKVKLLYEGNGFMYHMVRILTGTLLEVGTGKRSVEETAALLDGGERFQAGFLAPACGLSLKEVYY